MPTTNSNNSKSDKILTKILIGWILAGTFGDELVGVSLFGFESDALELSMGQAWWWYYQLGNLILFGLIYVIVRGVTREKK